jgi:hypothetical protein
MATFVSIAFLFLIAADVYGSIFRVDVVGTFELQPRFKKGKKTKFADIVNKKPKDHNEGSATYRGREV